MPSIVIGGSSSPANPVLDIFTAIGNPPVKVNVYAMKFRIFDISTAAKKVSPVQVFPITPGDYQVVDVNTNAPTGDRLGVGHYVARYDVSPSEPTGDHRIEWVFQLNQLSPEETLVEEFYVAPSALPTEELYCGIAEIRAEGFTEAMISDERILMLAKLATRYIDKMTRRWFNARVFDENNPMRLDGKDSRSIHLDIPIIRLDKLEIESQGIVLGDTYLVEPEAYVVYNRHISGMLRPDDRENPKLAFVNSRLDVVSAGLFPYPRIFPRGRQNVLLQGVFGYTDPNGTEFGEIPALIRQAACRLVIRDIDLEKDGCKKTVRKNRYRIIGDKEGSTNVKLQDLWLKGAFTGDSEIDNIIMSYKAPPDIGVA